MCAKCGDRFALLLANAKDLASISAFSVFPMGFPDSPEFFCFLIFDFFYSTAY